MLQFIEVKEFDTKDSGLPFSEVLNQALIPALRPGDEILNVSYQTNVLDGKIYSSVMVLINSAEE